VFLAAGQRLLGVEKTLIRTMNDMADSSCINLGLGELPFPTPRPILEHVRAHLESWKLGYTPNEGLPELRERIAAKSGLRGAAERVCVTVGAQEALFAVLMVLAGPGDEVLVPDPGYPAYASIVKLTGATPRTYPLEREAGFHLEAKSIEMAVGPACRAVVLNSPQNPSGAVHSAEEVGRLAAFCRRRNLALISDEVYAEITYGIGREPDGGRDPETIVINSLSKAYAMTGWRLGWCIVPSTLIKPLAAFHQLCVMSAATLSQRAALFALGGGADAEKTANLAELARRRQLIMDALRRHTDLSFIEPEGAFYVLVDVRKALGRFGDSLTLATELLKKEKVVTIPGAAFGERGEGLLRLSFAAGREEIEEGVRRLGRFLSF
jgi:aminotransferase